MSAEDAFLAALRANPADDTARLVYADWLDDHDDAHRASYLRAVVDLTVLPAGSPEYAEAAGRLFTAATRTDQSWRSVVGGRFDLVLVGFEVARKIHTIKVIREVTGFGLAGGKALSESVPASLLSWQTFETLFPQILTFLRVVPDAPSRQCGADLVIRPTPWPGGGPDTRFDVRLVSYRSDYVAYPASNLAYILGVPVLDVARGLRNPPMTLAVGVKPSALADLLRQVTAALNVNRQLAPGSIQVVPHTAE
jgi:uncharacterized protein (TIGR02996 family)